MERGSRRTKRKEKFLDGRQVRRRKSVSYGIQDGNMQTTRMEVGKKKQQKKENRRKIIFWNVAGIERQHKDFWNYIIGFDFIGLCETWLEVKGWDRIKDRLPDTHIWENINAVRERRKGRAKGGLLIGIRKDWGSEAEKNESVMINERIARTRIVNEEKGLNIFTVYNVGAKKDVEEIMEKITEQCEGCEGEDIIIGGDFNIRIGNLGGCREDEFDFERESKDKVIGDGGRSFVDDK